MAASGLTLRIGLTGGIGSGKSVVAALLARRGAEVVDTDLLARRLTMSDGVAIPDIARSFGDEFIQADGALDRERMRRLVFADTGARLRLEAILHPLIGAQAERQASRSSAHVLVFDVPLLVESGHWRDRVHKVLVVDCALTTQIERVMARSDWSRAGVEAVIARQASRLARRRCADAVLYNDAITPSQLGVRVDSLWEGWTGLHG